MITGEQLRWLRQLRNMKQEEMALAMNIRQQQYSQIENLPKISAKSLTKALAALNLSLEAALTIVSKLPPPPQ
jgi:transcriptional regulator with XRE-family HTH domain